MDIKTSLENGKTVVRVYDEVPLFFFFCVFRVYTVTLHVDGKAYYFTPLTTDCPFASLSL